MNNDPPRGGDPRNRDPRGNAPQHNEPPKHYAEEVWDDENWDEEEEEQLFQDEKLRGAIGLTDMITKKMIIIAVAVFVGVVVLFSTISWIRSTFTTQGPQGGEVTINVPQGASLNSFSNTLEQQNIIPSAFGFRFWLKFNDAPQLQAGEYVFHYNSSPGQVVEDLKVGPKEDTDRLIIPEGSRIAQIAQIVGRLPGFSEQKFLEVVQSGQVRSVYQPADVTSLEGFLFPDTYFISPRDDETTLLQRMVNQFDNAARTIGLDRSDRSIGHSPYETLIIASMIEAEARVDVDRGKISQVIENRLNAPMPLQIDATLLYGLQNSKQVLSNKDLRTPGPYNTYLNQGLPPTPIGNPGRKSLQAALAPSPGPWLYYVLSDADGRHAFATTLEEHNRNVAAARAKGLL